MEARALVWWHKLSKDIVSSSFAVVHLFGKKRWFLGSEDKKDDSHNRHKQLREGRLVSHRNYGPYL